MTRTQLFHTICYAMQLIQNSSSFSPGKCPDRSGDNAESNLELAWESRQYQDPKRSKDNWGYWRVRWPCWCPTFCVLIRMPAWDLLTWCMTQHGSQLLGEFGLKSWLWSPCLLFQQRAQPARLEKTLQMEVQGLGFRVRWHSSDVFLIFWTSQVSKIP